MKKRYAFAHNYFLAFFRGLFPFESSSRNVLPFHNPNQTFVWRNTMGDGYKIGLSYKDVPLEISNYLVFRTKELLLL